MRGGCSSVHDLRHSFATWLVSDGTPVNDVQRIMVHERPSTTLDLYTHARQKFDQRVHDAFADYPLTADPEDNISDADDDAGNGV